MSGGVLGTMDLLLRMKYETKDLVEMSDMLGHNILTNSEMLSGIVSAESQAQSWAGDRLYLRS
jgi:hypothetical protein